jgi:hypothetical protein
MKRYSAWVAFGLLLFVVLACNLSKNKNGNSNNANANRGSNRPANAEVYTDEVYTAKEEDGPATSTFAPADRKVHIVINLNKGKSGTDVKVVWIAEDVEGASNKELKTLEYTTKGSEKKIPGYITWSQDWPKGKYKVEIYIDGNLDRTVYFDVQ